MGWNIYSNRIPLLKALLHLVMFYPLLNLYIDAINDRLGADPVEQVIHFTGMGAINCLLISLLISPLSKLFKLSSLIHFRRMIGLYAFLYAVCHILNFLFFEVQFDLILFVEEIFKRPYITVGMTAFSILTALAVTSTAKIRRRMKKNWQKLHNLTYLIALLGVIHFYWSVKSDITEPLIYFALYGILMASRFDALRQWIRRFREH
jgi:sulfoxide reductase heme-binding subunit YedZ